MATAHYDIREIRFQIKPELTECYILCSPADDGTIGVGGWHHKTFPASVSVADILVSTEFERHLLWPLDAPEEYDQ